MALHLKHQNLNPTGNKYEVSVAFEQPVNHSPQGISWNDGSIQVSFWCSPKYSTLLAVQPTAVTAAEGVREPSQSSLESRSLSICFGGLRARLLMTHVLHGADLDNFPKAPEFGIRSERMQSLAWSLLRARCPRLGM